MSVTIETVTLHKVQVTCGDQVETFYEGDDASTAEEFDAHLEMVAEIVRDVENAMFGEMSNREQMKAICSVFETLQIHGHSPDAD